ncbi:undecaprenyl-diphosphate phosphatase [Cryptosporangium phraense]|uniref:Undecaprenyl-diphosphatase n=1 Tax=Cryptosporangium phraense TaxID=2593070 RepID=A0A545ARQ4_9ACTN|nr:undecaprenyl-diphosphate phosphatase [Cryptosporangium phraense]TQS43365.1 undecaprenyl-diphosphate phosphatase [Cryptosporangium phraense]
MSITYPEAIVIGALQGVTELFPVSSLGHSILVPAIVGGRWARDLSVSTPESPYLAFLVGLHVATALALLLFFWRDWVRIIGGFFSSIRDRRVDSSDQRLAWLIVLATIPVGITGLLLEHTFRTVLGKPVPAAMFLLLNGVILLIGERVRRRAALEPESGGGAAVAVDRRLSRVGYREGTLIGSAQILALLPGISRSGVTMIAGLGRGLSHTDAARFSFLLATPVIFAAGVLKIPDLFGPLGSGIHGQVLAGSLAAFGCAYLAVRFLTRYFETRTLVPFGLYCIAAGAVGLVLVA